MNSLEIKLRALAGALDTSALEALSSKGLLRRAQKDFEKGISVSVVGEIKNALQIKVDQFEVSIPEAGPAKARCSCPAAGICQHVLLAVLHLQTPASSQEKFEQKIDPIAQAEKELLAIDRENLERWAGKASFRAGAKLALQNPSEIVLQGGILFRFPTNNVQCHYVPGGGIEGMIVAGAAKDERQIVVAAIFNFLKSKGVQWELPDNVMAALEESEGAPRSRNDVIAAAQGVLIDMLNNGLARLSSSTQQRLATLAVSALGVNLPRLSLALRALSDECALSLARDARSDLGRLLNRMATVHALCTALDAAGINAKPELIGVHRTRYDEIGNLDLIGVAAWPWQTASGYVGITLLFWDAAARRWNSWSESRPLQQLRDFNPIGRYTTPGPWNGSDSPRQIVNSRFRLMNTRRNAAGRLSGSSKTRALIVSSADIFKSTIPVITDWTKLLGTDGARNSSVGLKESNPLDAIFTLQPAEWGERRFDDVTQTFVWMLMDGLGKNLLLKVRFDQFTEPAIKFLEKISAEDLTNSRVVGRLEQTPQGLSFHPFTIHQADGKSIHLALDTAKPTTSNTPCDPLDEDESLLLDDSDSSKELDVDAALTRFLDEIDDALLALAEAGTGTRNALLINRMEHNCSQAKGLNLQVLASALTQTNLPSEPAKLLRAAYLSRLHRQCAVVLAPL